jgi:DNA-binding CsgD family transcriptional regulator
VTGYARDRARDKITRLTARSLDLITLWRETSEVIAEEVPYYAAPCWFTLDPSSLLITSHFNEAKPELPPARLVQEYFGDEANKLADLARSDRGISTLHEATGGDPSGTERWQQNMALGADQEMFACLRTRNGEVWGALGLYREPGRPMFDADDKAFVTSVTAHLAEGARRSLLCGEASDPDGPDAPGLLIVDDHWEVESATPGIERWLAELPGGTSDIGRLPSSVLAVAAHALESARRPAFAVDVAVSRVLSRSGNWVILHGTTLVSATSDRVAVIIERAHPARIAPLLMSAYGLSEREQEITRLVLQGASTAEIADQLFLSAYTVQQHLENVFAKCGVRSRRDLVGKVFFAHYEPRVRDNERRAHDGRPLRGGPVPGSDAR